MARDYQYYFSQLRRIEDHREQQAEKEIRKLYKNILKETRQFVAEEYYQLADDGKLTFEILRSKSMDARFLQEVEERLGDLSIDVSREIKRTVEEMYQLSYDGIRDAVEKGKDSKELQAFFQGVDTATAQTAWASVDNTIMDIALEKNHKNIIWDIKREVATALTVGDRFDTMADRIAGKLNGNYKKAILIARTEVGRVREAGHLASAKNLNDALENGSSGMRMVKKWMTMRDGSVRDTHSRMNGVVVEMDEAFELPSGVKTMAPKQSGVAAEDCNCRCYVSYQLMDDEEFFKATGKHFSSDDSNKPIENRDESAIMEQKKYTQFNSGDEANQFFYYDGEERGLKARKSSKHAKWQNNLSKDEKDSICDYTGGGFYDINQYLRKAGDWKAINAEKEEFLIKNIDSAISRYELKDNIIVQRGVMEDALDGLIAQYGDDSSNLIGKIYHDSGYMSTTVLHGNSVATAKPVVFEIEVPSGKGHGAYVNQLAGQYQDAEYEFLIKRGSKFEITGIDENEEPIPPQTIIKMRLISDG